MQAKFKAPFLQIKGTRNEGLFENMGFKGKNVSRFQTKKITLLAKTKQTRETHWALKQQLNMAFVNSDN